MNDPYGSCDLINGVFKAGRQHRQAHPTPTNWVPRWTVSGDSDGWGIVIAGVVKDVGGSTLNKWQDRNTGS